MLTLLKEHVYNRVFRFSKSPSDEVVEAVESLWDLQPRSDSDPGEVGIVRRYIRKGNFRKARELLKQLPMTNAVVANLTGALHELDEEYGRAAEAYQLAMSLDPKLCAAHLNYSRLKSDAEHLSSYPIYL